MKRKSHHVLSLLLYSGNLPMYHVSQKTASLAYVVVRPSVVCL